MKHIYLNLKRFDVPPEFGGVNRISHISEWGKTIVEAVEDTLCGYDQKEVEFVLFLPEAHLLSAAAALKAESPLQLGCQSVYRQDTAVSGNFGAFTSCRTAGAMRAIGCKSAIIGHCEERADKMGILAEAGIQNPDAVNRILNQQIRTAQNAGLSVLYCIGETLEERSSWKEVLKKQLAIGLERVAHGSVAIAYEPVWSIGPGRRPAEKEEIAEAADFIKEQTQGVPVVYGGGLKQENAAMLADISKIDGGLVALTRFEGEIGFYPNEFLEVVKRYLKKGDAEL